MASVAAALIILLKIMLAVSGKDQSPFDEKTTTG